MSKLIRNPYPVMVTPEAAKGLPRWILWGLCAAYVLSGFIAREPWREQELAHFAQMLAMAQGLSPWLKPELIGIPLTGAGPLAHILGALFITMGEGLVGAFTAVRLLFVALMALAFSSLWYALYHLAHHPLAKPISFALGGQADTKDYARSLADAGLLALLACFGLLQFSHETTPSTLDLALVCVTLLAFALNRAPDYAQSALPPILMCTALLALCANGQGLLAVIFALAAIAYYFLCSERPRKLWLYLSITSFAAALMLITNVYWGANSPFILPEIKLPDAENTGKKIKLLSWFVWPAGYLATWTIWRWRNIVLRSSYLSIPLVFALGPIGLALFVDNDARTLFLALPALAILAAYIMPTLKRHTGAFIDWFTLLFFSFGLMVFWVFWLSMHLGVPAKPAQNIQKLVVGFEPQFSLIALIIGSAATAVWGLLVAWRSNRLRKPLWKSMALPAGGVTLFWVISMTLFLPVWDYARSHKPLAAAILTEIPATPGVCAYADTAGLRGSKIGALTYYTSLTLYPFATHATPNQALAQQMQSRCDWLILSQNEANRLNRQHASFMREWQVKNSARIPTKRDDASQDVLVYGRKHQHNIPK